MHGVAICFATRSKDAVALAFGAFEGGRIVEHSEYGHDADEHRTFPAVRWHTVITFPSARAQARKDVRNAKEERARDQRIRPLLDRAQRMN